MEKHTYCFPFGQPLRKVEQVKRGPKKTFVLGVYASAVHAKWIDVHGNLKVKALAVASEPEIFWTGNNADKIISQITIPTDLGKLLPANRNLNGPSGKALDHKYLIPLGQSRDNAWLCDLIPESRVNEDQRKAINLHYTEDLIRKYDLPPATIPDFSKSVSKERKEEILRELEESKAETLILLGDQPIESFLSFFCASGRKNLDAYGTTKNDYGRYHEVKINTKSYNLLPLCHPRQAFGYGNQKWKNLHDNWVLNGIS